MNEKAGWMLAMAATVVLTGACRNDAATLRDDTPQTGDAAGPARSCAGLTGFDYVLCADPEVRELDDDLAEMVNRLVARSAHERQADLRAAQASWRRTRDACAELALPKRRACIDAVYAERMNDVREALEALGD